MHAPTTHTQVTNLVTDQFQHGMVSVNLDGHWKLLGLQLSDKYDNNTIEVTNKGEKKEEQNKTIPKK